MLAVEATAAARALSNYVFERVIAIQVCGQAEALHVRSICDAFSCCYEEDVEGVRVVCKKDSRGGRNKQSINLEHTGLLELADDLLNGVNLDTGLALGRVLNLGVLDVGGEVNAEVLCLDLLNLLLLGLHDVGEGGVAGLVEAKVSGHNSGEAELELLETTVNLAGHVDLLAVNGHLRGEGSDGAVDETSEHLASLVVVTVDGLLAENVHVGGLLLADGLEDLGDSEGLELSVVAHVGNDVDTAVSTHGKGSADGLLGGLGADGDGDDLLGDLLLLEADGLLTGDLAEGVHGHLHVSEVDGRLVGLDTHLDGVVKGTLHCNHNLHFGWGLFV